MHHMAIALQVPLLEFTSYVMDLETALDKGVAYAAVSSLHIARHIFRYQSRYSFSYMKEDVFAH